MLGWLRSAEEVGYYRVSVIAAALVAFGMQIANSLSAPRMAAHHARGEHVQLQAITTRNAQLALLCAMPLTIVLLTAGGPIAGALFGAEFQLSHLPMSILAVGQLGNVLFGSVGVLLSMTGHEAHVARALWLTTLTNVAFNALLIPLFGTAGAAMATGSSAALGNAMLLYVVHRRLKLNTTVFPWLKNQFSNWRV
jgi:O-antigen/teichoic acid export membrane protein